MTNKATIWVQSCSAEADAAIWKTYQDSVRRHARKVVRADLSVEFHGVSKTYPGIDYADSAVQLVTNEVVRNAIKAEQEGYAAFAFVSTNDAGNREVKELTDYPAVFIAETAVHLAAQMAGKFAFLTHNAGSRKKMESLTSERFGLREMLVEGASINLTYNDFAAMYRDPAPILAQFEMKARHVRLPFTDTADKAHQAVRQINHTGVVDGKKPIVFTTLVNMEILAIIQKGCQGMLLDMFGTFVHPLEYELYYSC